MRATATALLASVLLLATASTAAAGDVSGSIDGDWRSRVGGVKQTVTFDERTGQVYGSAGCNRFTGSYAVSGTRITVSPLAVTMMACPEPQMDAEQTFLKRLQGATRFTLGADTLTLKAPAGNIRLRAA